MSAKSIFKNTAYMYTGEIISKIFQFIFIILLTRYLGAEGYGKISFAISLGWIIVMFSDAGINNIMMREMALNTKKIIHHTKHALSLKILFGAVITSAVVIVMYVAGISWERTIIVTIICISFVIDSISQLFRTALISIKHMEYEAVLKIVFNLSKLILISLIWFANTDIITVSAIYLASSVMTILLAITFFYRKIGKLSMAIDKKYSIWMLKESIPLLFGSLFGMLLINIDILMLTWLKGDYITGIYSAPSRLIITGFVLTEIMIASTYPYLVNYYHKKKKHLIRLCQIMTSLSLIAFMPIVLVGIMFAERILRFVFGNEFVAGSAVLSIFSLVLFIYHFVVLYNALFIIAYRVKLVSLIALSATIFNIFMNYFLILKYGHIGAAVATLLSYGFYAIAEYAIFSSIVIRIRFLSRIFRSAMALLLLIITAYFLQELHLFWIALIIVPLYAFFILLFRIISLQDIALLLHAAKLDNISNRIRQFSSKFGTE